MNISLNWDQVDDAMGYRLFFADYPSGDNLNSIDLGAATSLSKTLRDGAAFYVAVTAYNQDGSSEYSNVESLTAVNPANINTQNLPLQFQFVNLQTPVAFLPEDDAVIAARKSAVKGEINEVHFDDGLISMTVHIAPGMVERDNLPLSFCLDIGETCELLEVWNTAEQVYAESLLVSKVYTDVETSLYLELRLSDNLVETLRSQLSQPTSYTVRASLLDSENLDNIGVELAKVTLVDLPKLRTARINLGLKYGKTFDKEFSNEKFGIKFEVKGEAFGYLREKETSPGSDDKKTIVGASILTEGVISPKVFGKEDELIKLSGYFLKDGSEPFHTNFSISLLKLEALNKNWEYKKGEDFVTASKERKIPTVKNTFDINEAMDLYEALKEGKTFSVGLDSLSIRLDNEIKYKQRFVVVIIPLSVTAGARGSVGLVGTVGVSLQANAYSRTISKAEVFAKEVGPEFKVSAFAEAAVDVGIASGGVGGELTLVTETLALDATQDLLKLFYHATDGTSNGSKGGDDDGLTLKVSNILAGPSGRFYLFATYPQLVWSGWWPSVERKRQEKNLILWESFTRTDTLYERNSGKPETSGSIGGNAASSSETPEFKYSETGGNTSRPDNKTPWLCLYQHSNYRGASLCLALPKDDKPISFPIASVVSSFNDQISSMKIWGDSDYGIEVTLFEHNDFVGDQMIFLTHDNEESVSNFTNYMKNDGTINDKISSIVMKKAQPLYNFGNDKANYQVWENVNFGGETKWWYGVDTDFGETSIDEDEISSIKVWGGRKSRSRSQRGVTSIYFGNYLDGDSLRGEVIGISLHPNEQVHLPILGYANRLYLNDAIDGALVSWYEGSERDYRLNHGD